MPTANIRGVNLNYEILGTSGPWMALSPGGRRDMGQVRSLAQKMADHGYRVLIHDRRNCGASDVSIDPSQPEYEIWADDLYALLEKFNALPAIVGGGSSGCRLSLLFALKYPQAVTALLLYRVTGGKFAASRLGENYYGQFIRAAQQGGMAAVCAADHFRDRIAAKPSNRDTLMAMDPHWFIAAMESWKTAFDKGADLPVIGATEPELNSIKVPTVIIPGNDRTHNHASGETAHRMIPGSEYHDLMPGDRDVDLVEMADWVDEKQMAATFADFLRRHGQAKAA
jgi:pimeloyl-ACP methyl ester carboxylesterase